MATIRVLHLVGSSYNDFYYELSCRNARCNLNMIPNLPLFQDSQIALITLDGYWRFPPTLKLEDIDASKPMPLSEAIQFMTTEKIDLVMPHMYCIPGMTHYRALFDLLKIPYMGNSSDVMAIAAHKGRTKAIVAAAGVKVPFGELLRRGDVPTLPPPAIVKPAYGDNSLGMCLVKQTVIIVETFIQPGREVRSGIIVKDGQLVALPLEEYAIDQHERPIRTHAEKFPELDADGKFQGWPKDSIQRYWIKCHMALGCRHYSAFDFRIDPSEEPWLLEAASGQGLFPDYNNETLINAMVTLIHALGQKYDGDNRIGFWQVGFLGHWGEWHTYPNANTYGEAWMFYERSVSVGADVQWRNQPIGGEVRPELMPCVFANDPVTACPKITTLKPLNWSTCVQLTHSSYQWLSYAFKNPGFSGSDYDRAINGSIIQGYSFFVLK
ncbi:hypothetical protein I4U23_023074 [Adineta vaga]|nr:hypothetical protein I4U23_023074 [Adineta vaga]